MTYEHKKHDNYINVVGLIQSLIDFSNYLAEDIIAVLLVQVFPFVIPRLLLLGIKVYVNVVKGVFHVQFLYSSGKVFIRLLKICNKVTEPVDTIGGNIVGIALTVIKLLLRELKKDYLSRSSSFRNILGFRFYYLTRGSSIVFYLYVSEKCRITQIRLSARTDVVPAVGIVSTSSSSSRGVGVLQDGGKH